MKYHHKYDKNPTEIFGLAFEPTLGSPELDNQDWIPEILDEEDKVVNVQYKHDLIKVEFSSRNKQALLDVMNELKSKNQLNSILEIGVFRSQAESSTKIILDNKLPNTKYFGVDLNEANLTPIRNHSKNIFCKATNSGNLEEIVGWLVENGVETIDLLLIDGWHSNFQYILDFRFAELLTVGGYVFSHDTNVHPGPSVGYHAISEEIFEKKKLFEEYDDDWGCSTAKRIK